MMHGNQSDKRNGLVLSSSRRSATAFAQGGIEPHVFVVGLRGLLVLIVLACAGISAAIAQSAATLDGIVLDPSGALIPKARVQLKNTASGAIRSTVGNNDGVFSFSAVDTGDYVLYVAAKGFQSAEYSDIHLNPGDQRTLRDVKLLIGDEASITVTSVSGQISTDSGETSTLISAEDIEHLAIQGRDVTELLKILPGMSIVTNSTTFSNSAYDPSIVSFQGAIGNYAANGTQTNSTSLLSDGMDITDPGSYGIAIQNVNYDHVAEVKVQTGSFTADTAHGPVVINAIGKSGGNNFHGSLYTYARTNQLNSLDWIAKYSNQPAPRDRQIYPGFTLGGPVLIPGLNFNRSKKLTFFVAAEEYAQRNVYAYNSASAATVNALVPTAGMRNGDFSATQLALYLGSSYKPNTSGNCTNVYVNVCSVPLQGPGNQPVTNGDISQFADPLGKFMLNSLPLPNIASNGQFNYITTDFVNNNLYQIKTRLDYSATERTKVFLTYGLERGKQYQPASPYGRSAPNGMGGALDTPGGGFAGNVASHVVSTRVTSVLSATLTNEFYAGGAYFSQIFGLRNPSAVLGNPYSFLFNNGSKAIPGLITYGAAAYNGFPFAPIEDTTFGSNFTKKQMRLAGDNVTKLLGRHTLRAGIFYQWIGNPQMQQGQNTNGQLSDYYHPATFNDSDGSKVYGAGNYVADLYEGIIGGISQSNKKVETNLYFYGLSGYIQDHWLPSRHLSIDVGIRLEHFTPWIDPHGQGVAIFDADAYKSGSPTASPGVLYHAIDSSIPLSGVPTRAVFVEPRLGFAYDFHGDSKTVLRGGFGVYRQHDSYNDALPSAQTAQGQRTYATTASGHTFAKLNLLQPLVTSSAGFTPDATINVRMKGDDEMPRVRTYNLVLDQRLPHNVGFEIAYVGNTSDHLMESNSMKNINALPIGSLFKPQPDAGRIDTVGNAGVTLPYFQGSSSAVNTFITNLDTAHIDSYRPYPLYAAINAIRHRSYANYNGLQTMFFWQPRKGRISANYTWGKAMGAISGPDPINLQNDYLPLNTDRTHILNVTYSYSFGKVVNNRLLGVAVNGWEISGVTTMQGGPILTSLMSSNLGLQGTLNVPTGTVANIPGATGPSACSTNCAVLISSTNILGTPDYTLQPIVAGNPLGKTKHQYVDGTAFRLPTIGSNGPSYLGPLRGPLFFNSDLSMTKQFKLRTNDRLQLRMAAFNFINRANYTFSSLYPNNYSLSFTQTVTGTDLNSDLAGATVQQPAFGSTNIRTGRRIMEVSVKYQF